MIDTHAHLDKKTSLKKIKKIINISLNLGFAKKYKKIFNAIGYHPYDIKKFDLNKLKKLVKNKKVVAIGEIGLDKTNVGTGRDPSLQEQKNIFKKQFNLAQKLKLPVIIHCRGLHDKLLKILTPYKGVIHCFTGNLNQAQEYLKLGFYISFTGIITFSQSYNKTIKNINLNKILLETDCPYLAPEPHRGKKCEPWMIKFTAQKIAKIKKISFNKVIKQTDKNAEKLFSI